MIISRQVAVSAPSSFFPQATSIGRTISNVVAVFPHANQPRLPQLTHGQVRTWRGFQGLRQHDDFNNLALLVRYCSEPLNFTTGHFLPSKAFGTPREWVDAHSGGARAGSSRVERDSSHSGRYDE
jgi:hypothetical protein